MERIDQQSVCTGNVYDELTQTIIKLNQIKSNQIRLFNVRVTTENVDIKYF